MSRKNDLETRALLLVFEAGEEGILQSEMWKKLGVTSREGSRLAIKFEEKGVIKREKVLHDGRWTYKLVSLSKLVTFDSIIDCPCIICDALDKCFNGGQISPLNCQLLTAWMEMKTAGS
ncbi:MAG: transcriptional regulator [Candidatus Bathyarchaeota archaeon]